MSLPAFQQGIFQNYTYSKKKIYIGFNQKIV